MTNTDKQPDKQSPSICLMGASVDCQNRGVLALGASLVGLMLEQHPDARITFLVGNRNNAPVQVRVGEKLIAVPVINYRLSLRSDWRKHLSWIFLMSLVYRMLPFAYIRNAIRKATPWIRAMAEADLVGDIRGGDSFSDIYGLPRFIMNSVEMFAAILVHGDIVLFPQTYGPFSNPVSRIIARRIINHSSIALVRGRQGMEAVQSLMGNVRTKVCYCPDVAFTLQAERPAQIEIYPPLPHGIKPGTVGLNINGLMYNGGYTRNNMFGLTMDYQHLLPALIMELLRVQPNDLLLVSHTYGTPGAAENDLESCLKVRETLPADLQNRIYVVTGDYDQHELKGIIGQCDFFIGSRMHACIAALSQSIPSIGIAYSLKFAGVFDSVGMADWVIDGRSVDNNEAIKRVLSLYQQKEAAREQLRLKADHAREELRQVFKPLLFNAAHGKALQ